MTVPLICDKNVLDNDVFLGFNKIFTETARGLGMSTDQIYKMTNAVKLSGSEFSNSPVYLIL